MSEQIPTVKIGCLALVMLLVAVGLVVFWSSVYTLDETEQAVVIQFGKPVGNTVTDPGLHFKMPFVQEVRRFEKRILAWDGDPNQIPTRGREFIFVDSTARWRILDPLLFLKSVKDENGAQSRLDDIIDSIVRDEISSTVLIEIVRSKDWKFDEQSIEFARLSGKEKEILTRKIQVGREQLEHNLLVLAQKQMPQYGIQLVDVRIQRLNYIPKVQHEVFNRMISERNRVAARFRSEGEGQAAAILGETERKVAEVQSAAHRDAEIIRGDADAEATRIYNEAYSIDAEFFAFYRTMQSYSQSINKNTTLIISSDSDYFRYLRRIGTDVGTLKSNSSPSIEELDSVN